MTKSKLTYTTNRKSPKGAKRKFMKRLGGMRSEAWARHKINVQVRVYNKQALEHQRAVERKLNEENNNG